MHIHRFFSLMITGFVIFIAILWGFGSVTPTLALPNANIIYVDVDNTSGTYNGTSWATAYNYLQDALEAAEDGDQIWVAEGIYYPDEGVGRTNNSAWEIFYLVEGVDLYGGFDPGSGIDSFNERDWRLLRTILSGDIAQDDVTENGIITDTNNINGTNSMNVTFSYAATGSTIMDGFYITGGVTGGGGGGMQMADSSLTMINLHFSGNKSTIDGGGLANFTLNEYNLCNPSLTNVTFSGNWAERDGGGMFNVYSCVPSLTNVVFKGNIADGNGGGFYSNSNYEYGSTIIKNGLFSGNTANNGGGIYTVACNPLMMNVTFSGNNAVNNGGAIYNNNSDPTITNSILWGNTAPTGSQIHNASSIPVISFSDIQGSGSSGSNIDADPLFRRDPDPGDGDWTTLGDNDYGDLHLQLGSPAVDTGTNTGCPTFDLDGNPRPVGTSCDMGAFERLLTLFLPLILR